VSGKSEFRSHRDRVFIRNCTQRTLSIQTKEHKQNLCTLARREPKKDSLSVKHTLSTGQRNTISKVARSQQRWRLVGLVARAAGDKLEVTVTGGSSSRACAVR
jgi:hypothetical protein